MRHGIGRSVRRDSALIVIALALFAITLPRIASAIFQTGFGEPAWMGFNLPGLYDRLAGAGPFYMAGGAKQYGVVVMLIMDPPMRLFGRDPFVLNLWALVLGLGGIVAAFLLLARRYFSRDRPAQVLLAATWASFTPTAFVVAQRHVEAFELFFLGLGLYLFTGTPRQRTWSAAPVAAAALTKLLPGLLFAYQAVRAPKTITRGLAMAIMLLLVGTVLYDPKIGVLYPVMIATGQEGIIAVSTQQENQSLRGLMFKAAGGFRLASGEGNVVLTSSAELLNIVILVLELALVVYLLAVALRGRHDTSIARRSMEFGLAIVTMLVVSPHTAHDPMLLSLPAFTVLAYLWSKGLPRPWPWALTALAGAGAFLVGIFLPISLAARILPIVPLMELSGNESASFFGPNLGAYDLLGLPGLGLLLTLVVLVWLERTWPLPTRSAASQPI